MDVGFHADGPFHQVARALGVQLAVAGLHPLGQFLVTVAGRHQHGVLDGMGQERMALAGPDGLELVRRGGDAHRPLRFGVRDDIVIFAGARALCA